MAGVRPTPDHELPDHEAPGHAGRAEAATLAKLALGMTLFGSATPVSKIVTGAMPVFVGGALRVAIGALVLMPAVWRHRQDIASIDRRSWVLIGLIALFGMFGFTAFMLYGMKIVSGVVGAVVMSTTPAVTAAASILFLRERAGWRILAGIALAVGGVLVLQLGSAGGGGADDAASGAGGQWLGAGLIFAAVCCEAAYTLLGKRASSRVDPVLVAALAALISLPAFVALAVWQWPDFRPGDVSTGAWLAVLWYGAGTLALGSWLWYAGVARAPGAVAAGFMGLMPASALILSYVLLGEPFRVIHLAGFAIVFASVLMIGWEHARMARASDRKTGE